jgi:hypothetical protein
MVCAHHPAGGFLRVAGTRSEGQRGTPFGQGLLSYRFKVASASMSITNTYFVGFASFSWYLVECMAYSLHNTNDCSYILVIAGLEITFVLTTCIVMLVRIQSSPQLCRSIGNSTERDSEHKLSL